MYFRLRNSDADSEHGLKELGDDDIEKTPRQRGKINPNERLKAYDLFNNKNK